MAFTGGASGFVDAFGTASSSFATSAFSVSTGNLIVAPVGYENNRTVTSVTDTIGNTYTVLTRVSQASNDLHCNIAYCLSSSGTNANNVVTFNFSGNTTYKTGVAKAYSAAATAEFVNSATGNGATGGSTAATGTIVMPNDSLMVAVFAGYAGESGSSYTMGSSFVEIYEDDAANDVVTADRIISTGATISASTVYASNTQPWVGMVAGFKEASAGGAFFNPISGRGGAAAQPLVH